MTRLSFAMSLLLTASLAVPSNAQASISAGVDAYEAAVQGAFSSVDEALRACTNWIGRYPATFYTGYIATVCALVGYAFHCDAKKHAKREKQCKQQTAMYEAARNVAQQEIYAHEQRVQSQRTC
jgi:hypothetical protein